MQFLVKLSDMEAIMKQAEWEGLTAQLTQLSFVEIGDKVGSLEGISNLSVLDNPAQQQWGIRFQFAHLLSLNQALNLLLVDKPKDNWYTFFVERDKQIKRSHRMDNLKIGESLRKNPEYKDRVDETLEAMKYKIDYQYAAPIKVVYGEQPLTLDAKKPNHLALEANFLDLVHQPKLLDTAVILK